MEHEGERDIGAFAPQPARRWIACRYELTEWLENGAADSHYPADYRAGVQRRFRCVNGYLSVLALSLLPLLGNFLGTAVAELSRTPRWLVQQSRSCESVAFGAVGRAGRRNGLAIAQRHGRPH
jgi:hypothetical protein